MTETITFIKGNKSKDDKIFFFNGKQFTNLELMELILEICLNEDNRYPPAQGYDGGQRFVNCLQMIYNKKEITDDIKKAFKL